MKIRNVIYLLLLAPLSGCLCLPEKEKGEGVDSGYFSNCLSEAEKDPRNQGLFPKP